MGGNKRLHHAGLAKNPSKEPDASAWFSMAHQLHRDVGAVLHERIITVVIERPQVYVAAKLKGDPNDLISIAGVVGAIGTLYWQDGSKIVTYLPREWKGTVPKAVTELRVDKRLSDDEKKRVEWPAKSLSHNVYDAIALGLFYAGRGK